MMIIDGDDTPAPGEIDADFPKLMMAMALKMMTKKTMVTKTKMMRLQHQVGSTQTSQSRLSYHLAKYSVTPQLEHHFKYSGKILWQTTKILRHLSNQLNSGPHFNIGKILRKNTLANYPVKYSEKFLMSAKYFGEILWQTTPVKYSRKFLISAKYFREILRKIVHHC